MSHALGRRAWRRTWHTAIALALTGALTTTSAVVASDGSRQTGTTSVARRSSSLHAASRVRRLDTGPSTAKRTTKDLAVPANQIEMAAAPTDAPTVDPDTLIVHFDRGTDRAQIARSLEAADARPVRTISALDAVEVATDDRAATTARLRKDTSVGSVEANRIRYASADPFDPAYGDQSHLFLSRLPLAWEITKGSTTLDVAVVDTGVDLDHPDLAGRIAAGHDFVNNDTNAQDDQGHGTMVAGIAAAKTDNEIGVAGVAWNARIIPVKVLDADGSGTDAAIAQGIVWAASHGAEVLNLSLGGPGSSELLTDAVTYAVSHGVLVVAAAGNEGSREPSYPAAIDDVLAVGATDLNGHASGFTNHGPWVDMSAPGEWIVSTALADGPADEYAVGDGTSFSAPIVSGTALLMKAKFPTMTAAQIAQKLIASTSDRGPRGRDDAYGAGFLDTYAAVGGRKAAAPPVHPGDEHEPNDVALRATPGDEHVDSTIAPEGDVDWYRVTIDNAGSFTAMIRTSYFDSGRFEPELRAFDATFRQLETFETDPPETASSKSFQAEAPGTYYVRVSNRLASATVDEYGFEVVERQQVLTDFTTQDMEHGSSPEASAIGDVTGDGLGDVLLASSSNFVPGGLIVWPQRTDGTLEPTPVRYDVDVRPFAGLVARDMDGDDDTDVLVTDDTGLQLLRQSDGALGAPETVWSAGTQVGELEAGDIDGDGDIDAVTSTPAGVHVVRQDGGSWTATLVNDVPLYGTTAGGIEIGDVTGDGRADLVGVRGTMVRVLEQLVDGTFSPVEYQGTTAPSRLNDVEIVDLDHDGRLDVAATGGGNTGRLNLFLQSPDGMLGAPTSQDAYNVPVPIEAADMDGDGVSDLVVGHSGWETVGIFRGLPAGVSTAERLSRAGVGSSRDQLALGDVNDDGMNDIVVAAHGGVVVMRRRAAVEPPLLPIVTNSGIADGATGLARTAVPSFEVSLPIDASSVTGQHVRLVDAITGLPVPATPTYDPGTRTITLTPAARLLLARTYVATVDGLSAGEEVMSEPFETRFSTLQPQRKPPTEADVNGDAYDDVIVGAPGEDVGSIKDAGAFHVLYGSATGVKTSGSFIYTQNTKGVASVAEAGDRFGVSVATGDVNNDGYDDVAVGSPGEDAGSVVDAGLVHLFLGSPSGLRLTGSQSWTQDSPGVPGSAEKNDRFGATLAFGDFDATAGDDLTIGSPGEAIGSARNAGAIHTLSGRSGGLSSTGSAIWSQETIDGFATAGNAFGAAIAAGDFDGDTHDDLVVGAPGEDITDIDQGSVTMFNGTIVGLRPAGWLFSELLTGDPAPRGERFGSALASTSLGGPLPVDDYDDLAIGAPGDANGAGRVDVLFSDWVGPGLHVVHLVQGRTGSPTEAGDRYGAALAAGRMKAGASGWLAVGAPGEDHNGIIDAGVVHIVGPDALFDIPSPTSVPVGQDTAGFPDVGEKGDLFGSSVSVLDVDRDTSPDVIVGTPGESVGSAAVAGTVHVLRHADLVAGATTQQLTQGVGGTPGAAEAGDGFGVALSR